MEANERPTPEDDLDRTQAVPPMEANPAAADMDRTHAMPAPSAPRREDQDRRLSMELARRGVPPDEIERLLSLGGQAAPAPAPKPAAPIPTPPSIPPSVAYVPRPTITLPEFREATAQQRIEADRLLTAVNVARQRGQFQEAEKTCLEALERVPKDAAALELYGDILQGIGRVDDALYAYQRAHEADPKRHSAEKKYAALMLLQNREIELLREEHIPRNPTLAVLLSSFLPGAGQVYNGETVKGLFIALALLVCVRVIGGTSYGLHKGQSGLTGSAVFFFMVGAVVYLYGVLDANMGARRGKRSKSGWDL